MITLAAIQELTTRVREFPGEAMVSRSTAESYFLQFPHKKATRFHKRSRSEEDNNLCHISRGRILGPKLLLPMGCVKLGDKYCVHLPSVGEQSAN